MDPRTALESILCGHMIVEHAEALRDWIRGGGFQPEPVWKPVDCHVRFANWPSQSDIHADYFGLHCADLRVSYAELCKLDDSAY